MKPLHISTATLLSRLPAAGGWDERVESDGICRCAPQPASSPLGECSGCHRLDYRSVRP